MISIFVRKTKNWSEFATFQIFYGEVGGQLLNRYEARTVMRLLKTALKKEKRSKELSLEIEEKE